MKTNAIKIVALAAGLALIALPARAAWDSGTVSSQTVTSRATQALTWLEGQMSANGHHLKSGFVDENDDFQSFDDTGLTIDGVLALAAGGRATGTEAQATAQWVTDNIDAYVTGFDPDSLYAGALGKAMVFAVIYGEDWNDLDGHDLEADLRGRMQPNGHFTDKATDFESGDPVDFSNGIGDALDVLALAATEDGAPAVAVDYLLLQQCPDGGFRSQLRDAQCADNEEVDLDATSFALTALSVIGSSDDVDDAIENGLGYLLAVQGEDGSFGDNANSTGMAGVTLRGFGGAPDANRAADFVKTIQLTSGADNGAILLDKEGYDAAVATGLNEQSRTVAARATAQGVLALGLPAYPLIGHREPVEPSTTIALSNSSVAPGGTMNVSGGGFAGGEKVDVIVASDPVTVGSPVADDSGIVSLSFTLPSSIGPGQHSVTLRGQSSEVTIASPFTVTGGQAAATTTPPTTVAIVRTGSATSDRTMVAGALVMIGGALMVSTRQRRIVYPFKK
jgi:hypothetical protein